MRTIHKIGSRLSASFLYPARIIGLRIQNTGISSWGIYLVLLLALAGGAIALNNNLSYIKQNTILIGLEPLFLPILIIVIIVASYLSLSASITASKEYDRGTLEVMLYGPVNLKSFLAGVFFSYITIYAYVVLLIFCWINFAIYLTHLSFSINSYLILLISIVTTGSMIAYGLFISSIGGKTRTTFIFFILFIGFIIGVQVADQALSTIILVTGSTTVDQFGVIRHILAILTQFISYISPFSLLQLMMDDVVNASTGSFILHFMLTSLQIVILLFLSQVIIKNRGVR